MKANPMIEQIWTIGHSARKIDIFISLLREHDIKAVADVRMYPGSKRYPQFNRDNLARSLGEHDIRYEHFPELGGRRKAKLDSQNTAWRNEMFRGYADHMETKEFRDGIARLVDLATGRVRPNGGLAAQGAAAWAAVTSWGTAIMCAEGHWTKCHRGLIADYLKARGIEVMHIVDLARTELHPFTTAAQIVNGGLSYKTLL